MGEKKNSAYRKCWNAQSVSDYYIAVPLKARGGKDLKSCTIVLK